MTMQQIRQVLRDPNADLPAVRDAAAELAGIVENLQIQVSNLSGLANKINGDFLAHTHHFAVTDTNGKPREEASGVAVARPQVWGGLGPGILTGVCLSANVQEGTPVSLTRPKPG
jgi:hypothetical protein